MIMQSNSDEFAVSFSCRRAPKPIAETLLNAAHFALETHHQEIAALILDCLAASSAREEREP